MRKKLKLRIIVFLLLLIIVEMWAGFPLTTLALRKYDALRLALFAHRIAGTDGIVGTYPHSSVVVRIGGDDARKIVQIVSSAHSARLPIGKDWACAYNVKATFYKGTNFLGEILMCSSLFLVHEAPFRDDTELLSAKIYRPVMDTNRALEMKKFETQ